MHDPAIVSDSAPLRAFHLRPLQTDLLSPFVAGEAGNDAMTQMTMDFALRRGSGTASRSVCADSDERLMFWTSFPTAYIWTEREHVAE